ncbi:MAG TPA: LysM peptidoglycan-binding domain-containing protein, partial [Candidatus Kapabacteria bacterium]|nr:LysM peptidoglycan-binding domain-containing protein [Candidatus Kapabacteria bacterium]
AAGCRSSARAKRNVTPTLAVVEQTTSAASAAAAPLAASLTTPTPVAAAIEAPAQTPAIAASEPVTATEPVVQEERPATKAVTPVTPQVTQKAQPVRPRAAKTATKPTITIAPKYYVVKSGDTLEKIAKRHGVTIQAVKTVNKIKTDVIHPGQKLQLTPAESPLVRSEQPKRSKEA